MKEYVLVCPTDPAHNEFEVTAHVAETWVVNRDSDFIKSLKCDDVIHMPDSRDRYTCMECGEEAKVERYPKKLACGCHSNGMPWAGCKIHGIQGQCTDAPGGARDA